MIRLDRDGYKKLIELYKHITPFPFFLSSSSPKYSKNMVGRFLGEEVFVCYDFRTDSCFDCKHRFGCYTDRWGLLDG